MNNPINQTHSVNFEVRDYECDMQGIVNNAVYQNYLEHARHQFIHSKGLDFAEITSQGINLVLTKAELDYKRSLKSNDRFYITTTAKQVSKLKIAFYQEIYLTDSKQLMLKAKMTVASTTNTGKPILFKQADKLFEL
ncbi:acyl-CoA thioesterase [Marinomonas sp. C2222]|uniref:Acyl-CoA thioesterase n=1 Tax=Marinomonas sargassi TaxID=2984494 RepID=A0ABT2YST6_9GAMM|nr:acyl-CoA thioesterase [Marinomonas sargassi]MCV2402958.1 acyl-CoA thioesterase [Marinomonas sargassi]